MQGVALQGPVQATTSTTATRLQNAPSHRRSQRGWAESSDAASSINTAEGLLQLSQVVGRLDG